MSPLFKEQIADLTPDISHDVVKRLLRDICEAAHSTDPNGDAPIAMSEVEELLERIAKMRRTTKTAIKDEYKHIERAEYLQDGEFFQLPEGASELRCAPGFYFEPPSEEVQTDRALKGQPPSRGFIWRKPTPKESVPTRISDALFTEARVVLPGSLGPALVLEAPQADGTTNRMLLSEAEIIRDQRAALAKINYELNVKHYTSVERAITAVYPNDSALPGQYVERHGWTDAACTHFALTDMVLGSKDLPIISRVKGHDHPEGTLDAWREVAALADGNPAMIFSLSTQFASPTIQLQTVEGNAIINLVGPSSTGKTTVLRTAASVWGPATSHDPTQPEFMTRWRNTSNALESIAASRNGLGLVVDDLGTLSPDEAEPVAYMLGNGVGKGRLTRDVQLRESKKWAFFGVSSGEVTLRDHAQQARFRRSLGAGAESRFVSVTLTEVIPELHGHASVPDFARAMCDRLESAHGTAGPAFVRWLIEHRSEVGGRLNAIRMHFLAEAQKILPAQPTDQARRIVNHIAAIVAGGGLAADVLKLPWRARTHRESSLASYAVIEAGLTMLGLWLVENGGTTLTGIVEKLDEIREKVAAQSTRFPIVAKGAVISRDVDRRILGWRDAEPTGKPDEYRLQYIDFLPSAFREWGWDKREEKDVMRHLRDEKLLICDKPNELKARRKQPQFGDRIAIYRIDAAFFGEEITFNVPVPLF